MAPRPLSPQNGNYAVRHLNLILVTKFIQPNYRELSNKDLGELIMNATVYLECHMTVAKIKKMIADEESRKAFFDQSQ